MIEQLRSFARTGLEEALAWVGLRVDDVYGVYVGRIADVWVDQRTGAPRWLLVRGGRFGGHYTLIPYEDASGDSEYVWVPYERRTIRDAPTVLPTEWISPELDARLSAHYAAARGESEPPVPRATPRRRPEHAHRLGAPR